MENPTKIVLLAYFLLLSLIHLQAESVTTLYDINFDAPTHTIGQPPAYGSFLPTCRKVQYYTDSYEAPEPPVIVDSFGELDNRPCLFYIDPNQAATDYEFLGIEMSDYYKPDTPYPSYRIEVNIQIDALSEDDWLEINFNVDHINFESAGTITGEDFSVIGSFNFGQKLHLAIDIDLITHQYTVFLNDNQIAADTFFVDDFYRMSIVWTDRLLAGNKAAVDNIIVYGIGDQPELHVTNPTLGGGVSVGKTYPVTWYASSDVQNVTIEYSTDAGGSWILVSPPNTGNTGIYNWTIPDTPSNTCKLRLTNSDLGIQAESNTFRICPAVPDLPPYAVINLEELFGDYLLSSFKPILNDLGDITSLDGQTVWINGELLTFDDYWVVDINNQRQLLLTNITPMPQKFYIWQNGTITETVLLESGEQPLQINDDGAVLLRYRYGDYIAAVWINGSRTYLEPIPGYSNFEATAFNNQNEVTGICRGPDGCVPFVQSNGTLNTLALPLETESRDFEYICINNSGTVAASYDFYSLDSLRTFLWKDDQRIELEPYEITSMNDQEQYITRSFEKWPEYPYHYAFITFHLAKGGEKLDLRQAARLPSKIDVENFSLNNNGWITATKFTDNHLDWQPLLLVPQRQRSLDNISIVGPDTIYEYSTASLHAVGLYDDNCPISLTKQVTWQVLPQGAGIIDPNGILYTQDLEGIDEIVVSAEYVDGQPIQSSHTFSVYTPRQLYVPQEYATIQEAINQAQDGEIVIIADGTYTGTGNRDMLIEDISITIKSQNGPSTCILDLEGSWDEPRTGFLVTGTNLRYVRFEGLSIKNGFVRGAVGSGINIASDNQVVEIQDCIFENCYGALRQFDGSNLSMICVDSKFVKNPLIFGLGGPCKFVRCDFYENYQPEGISTAGVLIGSSDYLFENCRFAGNYKTGAESSLLDIADSSGYFKNCLFEGNRFGAVLCNVQYDKTTEIGIINCTFADNDTSEGVILFDGPIKGQIINSIFADTSTAINTAAERRDNAQVKIDHNNIRGDILGSWTGSGNIDANPLFIRPGYWIDNTWQSGDYRLKNDTWTWDNQIQEWTFSDEQSPCIDAGTINDPNLPTQDIEGNPRSMDGNADGQILPDMGAYEAWPNTAPFLAVNKTSFDFQLRDDEQYSDAQWLSIHTGNANQLDWSITNTPDWISCSQLTGMLLTEADEVQLLINNTGLATGKYKATFEITSPQAQNSPLSITVNLEVVHTLHVPKEYATIQEAIDQAQDGEIVIIADGTYTGPGNRDIDFLGKAITVQSDNGPENCIIDCQGTEQDPHRAFLFQNGETNDSVLSGLTITNGFAGQFTFPIWEKGGMGVYIGGRWGGAIISVNASPVISNCIIEQCTSLDGGGGIYCYAGSPVITDSVFRNNRGGGAAITTQSCSPTIQYCQFIANDSENYYSMTIFDDGTIFSFNGAGALYISNGSAGISNCAFIDNKGTQCGGLTALLAEIRLDGCTFGANTAQYWSAVTGFHLGFSGMNEPYQMLTAKNCLFEGNKANFGVAWLSVESNESAEYGFEIANCTFAGNAILTSNNITGALGFDGQLNGHITNSILADTSPSVNTAPQGYQADITIDFNNIRGEIIGDWTGTGNIDADSLFVIPGYWDDNATPDEEDDFWIDGDYHLMACSPCIDAGDPDTPIDSNGSTDLDGNPRIVNGQIDMGPYEFSVSSPADLLDILCEDITNNIQHAGTANSLLAKLDTAFKKLHDDNPNNDKAALGSLQAFINAVQARRGKKITEPLADSWMNDAQIIIDLLMAE